MRHLAVALTRLHVRLWLVADAVWWGWVVVACLSACLWIAGSEGGRRDGLLGVVSGQPCTLPVPGRVTASGRVGLPGGA